MEQIRGLIPLFILLKFRHKKRSSTGRVPLLKTKGGNMNFKT